MTRRAPFVALQLPDGLAVERVRSLRVDEANNRIVVVSDAEGCTARIRVVPRATDAHPGGCTCAACACSMCGSSAMSCDGQCAQAREGQP